MPWGRMKSRLIAVAVHKRAICGNGRFAPGAALQPPKCDSAFGTSVPIRKLKRDCKESGRLGWATRCLNRAWIGRPQLDDSWNR